MARILIDLRGNIGFPGFEENGGLWYGIFHGWIGILVEPVRTVYHFSRIIKSLFMVWFSINGQNIDLSNLTCKTVKPLFQMLWSLLAFSRASVVSEKVSRWSQSAPQHSTTCHCIGLRKSLIMVWSSANGQNVDWQWLIFDQRTVFPSV